MKNQKLRRLVRQEIRRQLRENTRKRPPMSRRNAVNEFKATKTRQSMHSDREALSRDDEATFVRAVKSSLSDLGFKDVDMSYHSPQNEFEFEPAYQPPVTLSLNATSKQGVYILELMAGDERRPQINRFKITVDGSLDNNFNELDDMIHDLLDETL